MNLQGYADYAKNAGDFFVLPEAVVKVGQLIEDDTASIDDIADVINYDPAIMSQVLKISNSAFYNFSTPTTTVTKAIQVIGTQAIYDLVLAYGVTNAFKDIDPDVIDLEIFWEQSVSCALICKILAEKVGLKEPEKLFVCGLLHNLGELVVVGLNSDAANRCGLISSDYSPLSLQKKHLGFSYVDVSSELLKYWGIPEDILQIVAKTHAGEHTAQNKEQKIMQLAYSLALNNVHRNLYSPQANISDAMYQGLGIDLECVNNALDLSNMQLMSALEFLSP